MLACEVFLKINKPVWIGVIIITIAAILFYVLYRKTSSIGSSDSTFRIYSAGQGNRLEFELPDHSKVILNPNSLLKVPRQYNPLSSKLILEGAAYFMTSGNATAPLLVMSSDLSIAGTGASFFVRAYPHESGQQVELLRGKLKVQKAYFSQTDNKPEILSSGEMVMINRSVDLMEKEVFDQQERELWINRTLKFNAVGIGEVIRILEDWYGIRFEFTGNPGTAAKFSGTYHNLSLKQFLERFCESNHCNFSIDDEKVVLSFD
jgi:ferric-dicitrate binding protein FerR (iron transport regulator)